MITEDIGGEFNFTDVQCDFQTDFAKFYKINDGYKISIIKVFKQEYRHFFSEHKYKLLKNIRSEFLVSILEINSNKKNEYVRYEFFESISLREWINSDSDISKSLLISVINDMAEVIDKLHENNLVHLDIIGNFLINSDGKIKLNDYDYVEELNDSSKEMVDLHSFFQLVYRLILFVHKKKSRTIEIKFNNTNIDHSSCKEFLCSLDIR